VTRETVSRGNGNFELRAEGGGSSRYWRLGERCLGCERLRFLGSGIQQPLGFIQAEIPGIVAPGTRRFHVRPGHFTYGSEILSKPRAGLAAER
jgi:hypothetical protein